MHVDAANHDLMPGGCFQAEADLLVPDAVLRLVAARVRLAAVAVAETGIDPQRDPPGAVRRVRARRPRCSIMSGEPQFT